MLGTETAKTFQKAFLWRNHTHIGCNWFYNHRSHLSRCLFQKCFYAVQIIINCCHGILCAAFWYSGTVRYTTCHHTGTGTYQKCITVSMITSCKFNDLILSCKSSGNTDCTHNSLCTGIYHTHHIHMWNMVTDELSAKRAASDGSERGINREYFASSRPAFMSSGGLTPAQRGTATHKFMQFSDYAAARADIESELARLVDGGFLSEDEGKAVNIGAAKRFFLSSLAERIFASNNVMREKKFAALFPAKFFYPELTGEAAEEKIVVQGIADCVFVEDGKLVIVDYKTDTGVDAEALLDRYSAQLGIYREALSQALGMPVKETLLYSFFMNSTVKVGTV